MIKHAFKILSFITVFSSSYTDAQNLFRIKERMDNLEGFDEKKYSWGFFLAGNHYDYKLVLDPKLGMNDVQNTVQTKEMNDKQNAVQTKGSYSFGAGLIGKMRLNESFDLRLEPSLQFVQRTLFFDTQENYTNPSAEGYLDMSKPENKERHIKSTYIDIPLMLEYHGNRWYNSRPYAAAGVNYLANLQSNQNSNDDNSTGMFRSTTHNFGWSVEAGIQFYFNRFKLTPGFRGTFFFNNELVRDNAGTAPYWTSAISTAQTRALMFVLKFE